MCRRKTTFPGDLCGARRAREGGSGACLCVNSFSIGALSRGPCKPVGDWTGSCTFRGAVTPGGLTCFSVGLSASAALGGVSRVPGSGTGVREGVWGGKGGLRGSNCGRSAKGRGVTLRGLVGRPEGTVSICRRAGGAGEGAGGWGAVVTGGQDGEKWRKEYGMWAPGIPSPPASLSLTFLTCKVEEVIKILNRVVE